ncbi:hypothetical protein AVEN_195094-1 [Araneus ventricosus]|uniref:Uncharacterized protein n=1 Tax=Araneus ventricosus TaxID=182803 RepID=A0A4Y2BIH5_ARAVE|nr:hypothetical protein AVEN_195094-1 [Araneus ventricosus]
MATKSDQPDMSTLLTYRSLCHWSWHTTGSLWPGVKVSASGSEDPRFESRFHQRFVAYVGLVHVKSDFKSQMFSHWCSMEVWRGGLPTLVSSSSDHGSE